MSDPPTIVTLTPLDVQSDSRTFKQAASCARFGFRSIVVEGYKSDLDRSLLPFELITAGPARSLSAAGAAPRPAVGPIRSAVRTTRRTVKEARAAARSTMLQALSWNAPLERSGQELLAAFVFRRYLARYAKDHVLRSLRHVPQAALYYLHGFYQFPAVWALAQLHRAEFVYDAHDFYSSFKGHKFTQDPTADRWIREFELRVEALCVARAKEVVTVSDGVADLIEERFGRRPAVVMNAQDVRLDRAPPVSLREAIGVGPDSFIVVVAGNAKDGAPLDPLIEAVGDCPAHVHLALIGGGYAPLASLVAARGLEGRVHLLPPVKPFEVVPFIRDADLAVIPYWAMDANMEHCLPNRFFSAVSAGVPLLYPALRDLMRADPRGELGATVDPRSAESLGQAIRRFVEDRALLARVRAQVRAQADRFSWEHEEKTLRAVLERAGARAARPAG